MKAQSVDGSPKTPAPRRKMSPRVATKDKWWRIEVLQRLKEFIDAYREALEKWRGGDRTVVFPAGSYAMRLNHGVAWADT